MSVQQGPLPPPITPSCNNNSNYDNNNDDNKWLIVINITSATNMFKHLEADNSNSW